MKICIKFTGEQPCESVISIKLQSNFIEITHPHGCPTVNLLHIFRALFDKNIYAGLLLCFRRQGIQTAIKGLSGTLPNIHDKAFL